MSLKDRRFVGGEHGRVSLLVGLGLLAGGLMLAAFSLFAGGQSPGRPALPQAFADGGDFSLDFIAAAPDDYDHLTSPAVELAASGLQFDARAINTHVVEQLEAEDFACGDTIVFFSQVAVDGGAVGSQSIDIQYELDAVNNGQQGVGYSDVVAVGISAANFAGQAAESGNVGLDGTESATLVSGPAFFPGGDAVWNPPTHDTMNFTVRITGLEAGEELIVRVDARFSCFAIPVTGNLHAAIASANTVEADPEDNDTINVGRQDIPMLGLGRASHASSHHYTDQHSHEHADEHADQHPD